MRKNFQGIMILVLATFLFGMYGIYSRLIGMDFEVFSQNWVRNAFVASLALVFVIISKKWEGLKKKIFGLFLDG